MAFDPISHAAGIGAGQEAGQRAAHAAELAELNAKGDADIARIHANGAQQSAAASQQTAMIAMVALKLEKDKTAELQNEIYNKWIPYGVRLQAGLMARRVQREDLIAALKAGDPTNADRIVQEADEHAVKEYDRLTVSNSKELREVNDIVKAEAEAGRLG